MELAEIFDSLNRKPDNPVALAALQTCLQNPAPGLARYFQAFQPDCHAALSAVLQSGGGFSNDLWSLATAQVCARHGLNGSPVSVNTELLAELAADPLCGLVLMETFNKNLPLECCLTRARGFLLSLYAQGQLPASLRPLLVAMAHQGFNNEYVWAVTAGEEPAVSALGEELGRAVRTADVGATEPLLLLYALYRPLAAHSEAAALAVLPLSKFASDLHSLITRTLLEPRREAELRGTVLSLAGIEDSVSRSVRAQYEESPYPRWLKFTKPPKRIDEGIQCVRPRFVRPSGFQGQKQQVLVAGCGTGQHSLQVAMGNPDADILALDLSSASLAYAMRMTERYGVRNITFLQGDLLALPRLGRKFHHIECSGVLHHIRDHAGAWAVLADCLHPGGTMHVGVYSKIARLLVSHLRASSQREGIGTTPAEVRRFRTRLLAEREWASLLPLLVRINDFFSLSMVRDLLFHVQEHQYTVDEIEGIARGLGLELVGVNLPRALRERAGVKPSDGSAIETFAQWRACERAYVGSMRMFQFWLQKATEAPLAPPSVGVPRGQEP